MNRKGPILSHFHVCWHAKLASYCEVVLHDFIVITSIFFSFSLIFSVFAAKPCSLSISPTNAEIEPFKKAAIHCVYELPIRKGLILGGRDL